MDSEGRPVPNAGVILRQGNVIIPQNLIAFHLSFLGLRAQTDASGRMVIPNLAPGDYDVFLWRFQVEGMIEAGSRTGYLKSVRLAPLSTTELRLTAELKIVIVAPCTFMRLPATLPVLHNDCGRGRKETT